MTEGLTLLAEARAEKVRNQCLTCKVLAGLGDTDRDQFAEAVAASVDGQVALSAVWRAFNRRHNLQISESAFRHHITRGHDDL